MAVISFQFSSSAGRGDQDSLLGRLKKTTGVRTVGHIDGESQDDEISRMCFAETTDASHVHDIVDELHRASGVEEISVEPRRGLIE